jgi:hypothetical protein
MEGRIHKCTGFLKKFHKCTPKESRQYLRNASKQQIRSLCECSLNVATGNIPVKGKTLRSLKKHKHLIKTLSFGKGNLDSKRKLLIQRGGFLPVLASAVIPLLTSILGGVLGK